MGKKILVLGWYGHGNIGDEAFKQSFTELWPEVDEWIFSDYVHPHATDHFDACLLGGGSFLDCPISGLALFKKPIAFVGVGVGSYIDPKMAAGLQRAAAIICRDKPSLANLPSGLACEPIAAADLVFARRYWPHWQGGRDKDICVLLSEHFCPRGESPEWVSMSWAWFCRELAQVLDRKIEEGCRVIFRPMGSEPAWDDRRAAAAVISRMVRAKDAIWYNQAASTEHDLLHTIASSRAVISLRLHGAIFAAAIGCPVVPLLAHDKMKGFAAEAGIAGVDYYALSAAKIEAALDDAMAEQGGSGPLNRYPLEAKQKWVEASAVVREKLLL